MEEEYKYMVFTQCMTFNQAPYIKDALHGFSIQKASFPMVFCVIDDASTDGEQELLIQWAQDELALEGKDSCRELDFGERIVAPLKGNTHMLFVILLLSENHYGKKNKLPYFAEWREKSKYAAFCEGDDYWIASDKLQKQVAYMESHPQCVLCYTGFKIVDENNNPANNRYTPMECFSGNVYDKLLKTNFVQTVTILSRRETTGEAQKKCSERGAKYDYGLFLELSLMGEFGYIPEITSSYRICQESASHSKSLRKEIKFALQLQQTNRIYRNLYYKPNNLFKELYHRGIIVGKVIVKHFLHKIIKYKY